MAGESLDDLADRRRVDEVGQAVAAQQQRGVRLERRSEDVDELGIVRLVRLRPDVAIDLVAPRMPHRLALGQISPASSRSPTGEWSRVIFSIRPRRIL